MLGINIVQVPATGNSLSVFNPRGGSYSNPGTPTSSGNSTTSSPASTPAAKSKSHTGAIVGGVVGGIGGLALLALIALLCVRRNRRSRTANTTGPMPNPPMTQQQGYQAPYGGAPSSPGPHNGYAGQTSYPPPQHTGTGFYPPANPSDPTKGIYEAPGSMHPPGLSTSPGPVSPSSPVAEMGGDHTHPSSPNTVHTGTYETVHGALVQNPNTHIVAELPAEMR